MKKGGKSIMANRLYNKQVSKRIFFYLAELKKKIKKETEKSPLKKNFT